MPHYIEQPPSVTVHALEVHDAHGTHVRTHLQPGGRYWPTGGEPFHPIHGAADGDGVIIHKESN